MPDSEVVENAAPAQSEAAMPATMAECHQVIGELRRQLQVQQEQIAKLQEQVGLDSSNSSKPPSSDGPGKNRRERRASGRKRGAQHGHPGAYRALVEEAQVDRITDCPVPPQCECGGEVASQGKPLRHQVFDVPQQVQAEVEEYRIYSGQCRVCGKAVRGMLPAGVPGGQIGPRALALVGVLGTQYHLTQQKVRDLLAQVLGVDFSVGAISQAHGLVAQALAAPVQQARQGLLEAAADPGAVVKMDETRYPREGTTNWVWAAVLPKLVVFNILPSRARYVAKEMIGDKPQALVTSDRYVVYNWIDARQRQVCWAHLLRDFQRIAERAGAAGRIGAKLLGAGYVLFRWREQGRAAAAYRPLQRRVRRALEQGQTQTQCRRTQATCAELLKLEPALWNFLQRPDVHPTNNDSERAIRNVVLKRKVSGPTRSRRGDDFIARGYTVLETCKRQGRNFLGFMNQTIASWLGKGATPSLLPAAAPVAA
jgi:transposase